jgi:hypothetical protein
MKRWMIAAGSLFFVTTAALAAPAPALTGVPRPERAAPETIQNDAVRVERPRVDAEGCVPTPVACNTVTTGRLAAGDCTADGKYADFLRFQGSAGDYVEATIRPLSSSLTNPLVGLLPPPGDASLTPFVYGGSGGATVGFVLPTSGAWDIAVGTNDLFGSGDYAVRLFCERDPAPTEPHNCFSLPLLCNQTAEWNLTNESCRWDDGSGVYNDFGIDAVAGDVLNVDMTASGFTPVFGIYTDDGSLLASSTLSGGHAKATFFVPAAGVYHVLVTSNEDRATGPFTVSVSCGLSGCLEPVILQQPASTVVVPFGQRATLTASANASVGGLQYEWFDARDIPTSAGTGATFQTPPVTAKQTYYYVAKTRCGQTSSRLITVTPSSGRRRSVTH